MALWQCMEEANFSTHLLSVVWGQQTCHIVSSPKRKEISPEVLRIQMLYSASAFIIVPFSIWSQMKKDLHLPLDSRDTNEEGSITSTQEPSIVHLLIKNLALLNFKIIVQSTSILRQSAFKESFLSALGIFTFKSICYFIEIYYYILGFKLGSM